ncbi:Nuclear pore complex, nup88/rnup84 component, partial [Globisporangium splendens]
MLTAKDAPRSAPKPAASSAPSDNNGGDDWVLRKNLELCGSVLPPVYADVTNEANLNTFDVNENGNAVIFGENGRLFLVNLFQVRKKETQGSSSSQQHAGAQDPPMVHLVLDPPLPADEVKQVEQVKVNASGSHILVIARKWVKVVKIPADVAGSAVFGRPNGASSQQKKSTLFGHQNHSVTSAPQRFCVRFADGTTEDIMLDASKAIPASGGSLLSRVQQHTDRYLKKKSGKVVSISREAGAATVRQIGYFSIVVQAAWHPLSDSHVVVLSDAEEICVFNTNQDVSKSEQRHLLDFQIKGRATGAMTTSFSFGSAHMLWDIFTCYILRSDGSVYALCPLIPYDCRISSSIIATLRSEVDAHLSLCKKKMENLTASHPPASTSIVRSNGSSGAHHHTSEYNALLAKIAELKSQKYWLQESWTPDYSHNNNGTSRAKDDTEFVKSVKPHISGISPDTWPLALQGAVEVTPKSVIEGKHNVPGGSSANSLLLVPYASRSDKIAGMNPFLMRSFTSGHVELMLLDAPIRPQWKSGKQMMSRKLPALLLECLNLGIDDSGGKAVLERDPADPRLVYSLHSTGVHVINVSWVFALATGKQFTSLPKSSARHIFSVSPGATTSSSSQSFSATSSNSSPVNVSNIVGGRVVKNVFFGHLLLLRLASGNFEVVNVSAASSELLKGVQDNKNAAEEALSLGDSSKPFTKLPGALAPIASAKTRAAGAGVSNAIRPFSDIVEEKIESLTALGSRVKGNTMLHEVDDAVLAFVIERMKILFEDVEYIDDIDTMMKDRLCLHAEMIKTQTEKAGSVQQSVVAAKEALKKLQEKMDRALGVQQNLRKRAAAVLQAVKENQPNLSRAEREFKIELEQMSVEVRRMKPRVAQLTVSGQRMVRNLENVAFPASSSSSRYGSAGASSLLSDDKKKMCFEVLRAETQLIDDTKALIDDMTANLQHLKA